MGDEVRIPCIRVLGCNAHHPWTFGPDDNRRPAWTRPTWMEFASLRSVVHAWEIQAFAAKEANDDLDSLFESAGAVIEREAKGVELRFVPSSTQAENQSTCANLIDGVRHFCQQCRIAKVGAGY